MECTSEVDERMGHRKMYGQTCARSSSIAAAVLVLLGGSFVTNRAMKDHEGLLCKIIAESPTILRWPLEKYEEW